MTKHILLHPRSEQQADYRIDLILKFTQPRPATLDTPETQNSNFMEFLLGH